MESENKPDLNKVIERFEAWWLGEIVDRPVVTMNLRQSPAAVPPSHHPTHRDRWLDIEYMIEVAQARSRQVFLADNLPIAMPNLGPEACATPYGAEIDFEATTSYARPVASNCGEVINATPDFGNFYWQHLLRQADALIENGKGRWITGLPDFHLSGDLLAALRDPQDLLMEMAEDLDSVQSAIQHLEKHVNAIYESFYSKIEAAGLPTVTWLPCVHWGRALVSQCDLICMVSPSMFQRTILPALEAEMASMERAIFHLDGPKALVHLDALLEIKPMHAVQWAYGAQNGPAAKWIDVYKKIQAAGKSMQILCEGVDDALAVMEHLKPSGCWFALHGDYEHQQIEGFLKIAQQWAARNHSATPKATDVKDASSGTRTTAVSPSN